MESVYEEKKKGQKPTKPNPVKQNPHLVAKVKPSPDVLVISHLSVWKNEYR